MHMNPIAAMLGIRAATHAARRRTGDENIVTSTQIGYWRVERVTCSPDGARIVKPLTDWAKAHKVIDFLNAL